jgi:hypothetical protein
MNKEQFRNRVIDAGSVAALGIIAAGGLSLGIGNAIGGTAAAVEYIATGHDTATEGAIGAVNDMLHIPLLREEDPFLALPLVPVAFIFGALGAFTLRKRFQ